MLDGKGIDIFPAVRNYPVPMPISDDGSGKRIGLGVLVRETDGTAFIIVVEGGTKAL